MASSVTTLKNFLLGSGRKGSEVVEEGHRNGDEMEAVKRKEAEERGVR